MIKDIKNSLEKVKDVILTTVKITSYDFYFKIEKDLA